MTIVQRKHVDRRKPNLFVVGATKGGTTSLHNYLKAHPQIFMSEPKEPGYFLGPTISKFKTLDEYLEIFEGSHQYLIRGESSTGYTHYPNKMGVARRIHEFNSSAMIIYIIRDPIERTISHYWWNVRWEGEKRDPYLAILKDNFYQNVSYYALQINQYLKFFSKNQIKILTLESLKKDPFGTLKELFTWLGVDSSYVPTNLNKKYNSTPKIITKSRINVLERLRFSKLWDQIGPLVPKKVRSFFRRLNEVSYNREQFDFTEIIEVLRPIYLKQTKELLTIFDLDVSEWRTLYEHQKYSCSLPYH